MRCMRAWVVADEGCVCVACARGVGACADGPRRGAHRCDPPTLGSCTTTRTIRALSMWPSSSTSWTHTRGARPRKKTSTPPSRPLTSTGAVISRLASSRPSHRPTIPWRPPSGQRSTLHVARCSLLVARAAAAAATAHPAQLSCLTSNAHHQVHAAAPPQGGRGDSPENPHTADSDAVQAVAGCGRQPSAV